jgi:hypothetical protein
LDGYKLVSPTQGPVRAARLGGKPKARPLLCVPLARPSEDEQRTLGPSLFFKLGLNGSFFQVPFVPLGCPPEG